MKTRLSMPYPPLLLVAGAMILAGVVLRFLDLGFPDRLTWDEHHFVENARNYLTGQADWNDHPPLGKLLMAFSMKVLGDTSFAYRLPSALLGLLSITSAGLLARAAFRSNTAAFIASAFVAADGFFIAYSRTALLDGMLTSLSLTALWLMTLRGKGSILLAGAVIGTAMSIKMSALSLLGPFLAIAVARSVATARWAPRLVKESGLFGRPLKSSRIELAAYGGALLLAFLVYLSWWRVGLGISGQNNSYADAIEATRRMMEHHAGLTDWKHPLLSKWWTWLLPTKTIMMRHEVAQGTLLRVMSMMGNPLLWWGVTLAIISTLISTVGSLSTRARFSFDKAWLMLAVAAYLSPWILTNRDSYIYHYLPSYAVGLVLLSGIVAEYAKDEKSRSQLLLGVCLVAVVSSFYAPVWAQIPISENALKWRPLFR